MPLASHLRCVALALGISTALGCANRNPTRATRGKPRPWPVEGGGNPRRRAARPVVDALPGPWAGTTWWPPRCRHNRDLAAADAHARALLGHLRGAQGERWPRTEVGYGYQYGRDGDDQTLAEATDEELRSRWKHTARLDLSYQLDLWGEVRARIAAAKADAEAAQAARDLLRVSVASQTTPRLRPRLRPGATGRGTTPIGRPARREPGAERTPARRRPFQRAAATPAAGLARADPRRAADARGAAARGTLRTGAAQRALAAPVGRSCRDLRRHTATAPCPAHRRRLEPAGAPPGRPRGRAPARRRRRPARAGQAELYPRISFAVGAETSAATLAGLGGSGAQPTRPVLLLSWRFPTGKAREAAWTAQRQSATPLWRASTERCSAPCARSSVPWRCMPASASGVPTSSVPSTSSATPTGWRAATIAPAPSVPSELLDSQRSLVADRARLVDAEMRVAERQVELFRALGGGWQAAPSPSHQENGQ